ncbi:MAG: GntR family transcriptional regulator, partial [Coprothermobacterota bacterium]|nr:GntR family transcriptional regulator [Coprothermobacterota bacterium]
MNESSLDLRRTMRTRLAEVIREAILSREFTPGEKLAEGELCAKYQVSRTPLREALVVLEQEGLVEIRSHLGVYVTSLSNEEIVDLLRVEIALEGLAVSQAAGRITDQELAKLEELHEKIHQLAGLPDLATFYQYDRQFHALLVTFSSSPMLSKILEKQLSKIYLSRFYTTLAPNRLQHSVDEHKEIIQALRSHDPQGTRKALVRHLESVIEDFAVMSQRKKEEEDPDR